MRILYGVVGEGMGHATRSKVILEHLLSQGHDVQVVVSGKAHGFLKQTFEGHKKIKIREIQGLTLAFEGNKMDLGATVLENLWKAPKNLIKNVLTYFEMMLDGFQPQAVISDFESWAYFYAINHGVPFISIDNQQAISRCAHKSYVTNQNSRDFWMTSFFTKMKLPGAYHYIATSFFFPPVKKARTTLVSPILRPEILAAKSEPGEHILVYPSAALRGHIVELLRGMPYEFRVYGMPEAGEIDGHIHLRPFSQEGFIEDFRTARAVIAGGGFSMMSEAVHLHVPMLAVPIEGQYEQEFNARYLKQLGYGDWTFQLDRERVLRFIEDTPRYRQNLARYISRDNSLIFGCIDELLRCIKLDEPAPARLQSPALSKYAGPLLPEERDGSLPWGLIANPALS
ncbi:MAG: teichoic acid biosynthesis protein [Myxococcales bacterium]|nr:teichoic acid biosynthesis protein [Myxococcales bacterium]MCB9642365.1 teichoic acid biosynthesis protein [Myxococcales bacterium]